MIGDLFAMAEEDTLSVGWNFSADFAGQVKIIDRLFKVAKLSLATKHDAMVRIGRLNRYSGRGLG